MAGRFLRCKITGVLVCLFPLGCGPSKADPKGVEQQLASAIPLHSSQAQVLDYLNRQKIGHSRYHRDATSGNEIGAEITVKSTRDIVDPTYGVTFLFDDQGRLTAYDVEYLGYIGL